MGGPQVAPCQRGGGVPGRARTYVAPPKMLAHAPVYSLQPTHHTMYTAYSLLYTP